MQVALEASARMAGEQHRQPAVVVGIGIAHRLP